MYLGFFRTASDGINQGVAWVIAVMGMAMALIVVVQVVARYLLNHSLFWSEELARYLLVWLTFLGASVAYHRGVHPGVDFLYARFSPSWQCRVRAGIHLVSLVFFAVMVARGAAFAWFVRLQISPALSLPKWVIMAVVPLAGLIFMVHGLCFFVETVTGDHNLAGEKNMIRRKTR